MKITVCKIEEGFTRDDQQLVRIDFSSEVVCGSAHLVATDLVFRIGDELDVELDYYRCDNCAWAASNAVASVQYNHELDFYTVCGDVSMVHEDGCFWVEVDDFRVMLEPVSHLEVKVRERLQFVLRGLELWPTRI